MRMWPGVILIVLVGSISAKELSHAYPIWNVAESVADYAAKVSLPPTQTLDLGNGVKMELILIPGGKFIMGTSEPTPPDEEGFNKQILLEKELLALSASVLINLLVFIAVQAFRRKRPPQLSLYGLLLMTIAAGACVLCGLHWRQSAQRLAAAHADYEAAKARYDVATSYEKPAHPVMLTRPFYMGKYTVTQEQYQQMVSENPSNFIGKDNPVEMVSWDNAQTFCQKVSERTKQMVRLPTEAEWEYSCRAGTTTKYYSGDAEADLARAAWYSVNGHCTTHPVGQKLPNRFGLYDMLGNIWQWCGDWAGENYRAESLAEDPQGPAQGAYRVVRGGSWYYNAFGCRSANRYALPADFRANQLGFRVVVPISDVCKIGAANTLPHKPRPANETPLIFVAGLTSAANNL